MPQKYAQYRPNRGVSPEERRRIHPIWRGVGFAIMILFPIISYAAMKILLTQDWFPLPVDLLAKRSDLLYKYFPDPLIYIKVITFVVILVLLFAVFTFFSFLISSAFGSTQQKDPYYVPPVRRQPRRRV